MAALQQEQASCHAGRHKAHHTARACTDGSAASRAGRPSYTARRTSGCCVGGGEEGSRAGRGRRFVAASLRQRARPPCPLLPPNAPALLPPHTCTHLREAAPQEGHDLVQQRGAAAAAPQRRQLAQRRLAGPRLVGRRRAPATAAAQLLSDEVKEAPGRQQARVQLAAARGGGARVQGRRGAGAGPGAASQQQDRRAPTLVPPQLATSQPATPASQQATPASQPRQPAHPSARQRSSRSHLNMALRSSRTTKSWASRRAAHSGHTASSSESAAPGGRNPRCSSDSFISPA